MLNRHVHKIPPQWVENSAEISWIHKINKEKAVGFVVASIGVIVAASFVVLTNTL
jgi:hypothetical protein